MSPKWMFWPKPAEPITGSGEIYLGGNFTTVAGDFAAGQARNRAACVDATVTEANPALRAWHPVCGHTVFAMVLSGSDMYLGGDFTSVRGTRRNYAACVDAGTDSVPALREWNPNCNDYVYTMLLSGSDMYLGGDFTFVGGSHLLDGGTPRNCAACVDSTVTAANPACRLWNPNCSGGVVLTMLLSGSDMYLGGFFTSVRGEERNRAACVDATVTEANPALRAWNPNCGNAVWAMVLSGSDMYLGGFFTSVRGEERNRAACVDATVTEPNPALRAWNPKCDTTGSSVRRMVLSGSDMYLGGTFTRVRGIDRNRAACVDANPNSGTPALREWNPNCNNTVLTMLLSGSDMYLGGSFQSVGGTPRNRAACIDATVTAANPALRAWNPNCNDTVWTMLLVEDDS